MGRCVVILTRLHGRAHTNSCFLTPRTFRNVMRGVPGAQRQLTRLVAAMRSPNKALRTAAIRAVLILLEEHLARNSGTGNGGVFLDDHVSDVETALRAGLTDAESAVREMARAAYHMFSQAFVQRAHGYAATTH